MVPGGNLASIGITGGDVGQVCTHVLINKWSKYKPTRYRSTDVTGFSSGSEYWKGTLDTSNRQTCGLLIPWSQTFGANLRDDPGSFLYKLSHGLLGWTYLRPTGGIDAFPFRLMDFDGYEHDSVNPLPVPPEGSVRVQGANGTMNLHVAQELPSNNLGLAIMDAAVTSAKLVNFYACALIYNGDYSRYWWKSASKPLSALFTTPADLEARNILFTGLPDSGTYYVRTFLSSVQIGQNSSPQGEYIACENEAMQITFVNATPYYVTITKAMWDTSSKLSYSVTFTNNTGAAVSVTGMRIDFVNGGGSVVKTVSIASRTIGANSYYRETGTQLLLRQDGMKMKVYATFGTTNITEEKTI